MAFTAFNAFGYQKEAGYTTVAILFVAYIMVRLHPTAKNGVLITKRNNRHS